MHMPIKKNRKSIVCRLALQDLRHEWILTLCQILAISAVLSPLLLLFGLKYGIVDWGREYLTQDPRYREIRPLTSKSFDKEWFTTMDAREDVTFVTPMTRQISATIKANVKGGETTDALNIVPTGSGDPLILENSAVAPKADECVLTRHAAESLNAKIGDILEVRVSRTLQGRYEYGSTELKVAGILSVRAGTLKSIYVQLNILEAVERYKDGEAVPEFGWAGDTPKAYPVYDCVMIVVPEKLSAVEQYSLCSRTGFTKIEELDKENLNTALHTMAGFQVSPSMSAYRLYTVQNPAGADSIKNVRNKLRGKNAFLSPWVTPVQAELVNKSGTERTSLLLHALETPKQQIAEEIGLMPVPAWEQTAASDSALLRIMVPENVSTPDQELFLEVRDNGKILRFPVSVMQQKAPAGNVAFIPGELAGILRLRQERNIAFSDNIMKFTLFRKGYAGFRLYAESIFDVDGIRKFFAEQNLPVHTEIQEITKVIELDRGMTLIFALLAFVGITGSAASLIASLYASVERKKRDMSVLRLIGLSGASLFRFPVYQGMFIGAGGFILSLCFFAGFAQVINAWFRPYIYKLLGFPAEAGAGVSFCRLPLSHISGAFFTTVIIAGLAAMIAAMRVSKIDPAEALRDE